MVERPRSGVLNRQYRPLVEYSKLSSGQEKHSDNRKKPNFETPNISKEF